MIKKNTIPEHWEIKKLADVCTTVTDGTHKTPKYLDFGIPFISIANIRPFAPINFNKYKKFISETEHTELSKRAKAEKDDILFPRIGTLGYAKRVDWDYEVSIFVGLGLAKPKKEIILPKFLEYYMNTQIVNKFSIENANGSGRLTLPLEASRNMSVVLPPLTEQTIIVAKIEELFTELDKAKEQLEIAQQQLKVYRQSVLKWAFEGRLTEDWRNKSLDYEIRFQSESQEAEKTMLEFQARFPAGSQELPEGWNWVTIAEIGRVKGGKRLPKGENYSEEISNFPYLRVTDFENQTVNQKRLKFLKPSTQELIKNYIISKNDVYISIAGTIGLTGTIPEKLDGANLTENAAKITDLKGVDKKYLSRFLASFLGQSQINESTKTTAQPKLSLFRIEKISLPLPSIEEQNQIIQEIDSRLSVCDNLEETINESLQQAESLRQSILKKAFEGKLI